MSVVTKKGDSGKTGIIGKSKVSKSNFRVETYGYLDEVNSTIGLCTSKANDQKTFEDLLEVQKTLMIVGSHLADPKYKIVTKENLTVLKSKTEHLENQIKTMEEKMPKLTTFIVPIGTEFSCNLHIARTKVRTLERKVVRLSKFGKVNKDAIQYLNRLSDYLFTLARHNNYLNDINDVPWKI
jgi:cob(I)alamin adenosyltransferase